MAGPVAHDMRSQSLAPVVQRGIVHDAVADGGRIQVVECWGERWQVGLAA